MLVAQAVISAVQSSISPYNLFIFITYQSINLLALLLLALTVKTNMVEVSRNYRKQIVQRAVILKS